MVITSIETGPRDFKFLISQERVKPESKISSTIKTFRPVKSMSKSLIIRTTPLDLVPEPYELTAMKSI